MYGETLEASYGQVKGGYLRGVVFLLRVSSSSTILVLYLGEILLTDGRKTDVNVPTDSVADPGSGTILTPWIRDPGRLKIGIRIRDEKPGSYFRVLKNNFLGLNT